MAGDVAPSFVLLSQEGYLIRSLLTGGLNALITSNPSDKGLYYSAFFQLSIGIERLLKVVLIVDHMRANSLTAPTDKELKGYGHDLVKLFGDVCSKAASDAATEVQAVASDPEGMRILKFLSQFAKQTRYHNLNKLATQTSVADPLAEWQSILDDIYVLNVDGRRVTQRQQQARSLAAAIEEHADVFGHDLMQQPLTLQSAIEQPLKNREATPFALWHFYRLLKALKGVLRGVQDQAHAVDHRIGGGIAHVPFLHEFLDFLRIADRKVVLKKRRWP